MHDAEYYESIGFKCGLEVHQRLATKEKLFCSCNALPSKDDKIAEVERRQRAVAGELGKVDRAAIFETGKDRHFIYNLYDKSTCLVDIDEEPPHELNAEALDSAFIIVGSLNASVPDEIEVMRKEVVDGSDPSAFQRTMQIGYNGYIEVNGKRIKIPSIFLEEEASGIVANSNDSVVYDVSRLGIPLVEIDTGSEITNPEEAKEVALRIGTLLRLTGKVQRGIGTIRQDVNISIASGARVEIKGFQELETMDKIIEGEVERQQKLIEIKNELERRGAAVHEAKEITQIFKGTKVKLIEGEMKNGGVVYGFRLEKFKGIIGKEISPGMRLGSEISEYAKIAGVGGIIHSDENLSRYGFSESEISQIGRALGVEKDDAFAIIVGDAKKCARAVELAIHRARIAIGEVPSETRVVDSKNGVTRFLRPIAGGARMYPETDVKPVLVDEERAKKLMASAPNIDEMQKRLEKELGNRQIVGQLILSPMLQRYLEITSAVGADRLVVALTLLEKFTELRRRGIDVDRIGNSTLAYIFNRYEMGEITRVGIGEVIASMPVSNAEVDKVIKEKGLERISGAKLRELVSKLSWKKKEEIVKEIMSKYRVNVEGDELLEMLKKNG